MPRKRVLICPKCKKRKKNKNQSHCRECGNQMSLDYQKRRRIREGPRQSDVFTCASLDSVENSLDKVFNAA